MADLLDLTGALRGGEVAIHAVPLGSMFCQDADHKTVIRVHVQHANRCSSDVRQSGDPEIVPSEVVAPTLCSGVEQGSDPSRLWIDACEVRTLVQIAVDAREGEIVHLIGTAMFPRYDMLELQSRDW